MAHVHIIVDHDKHFIIDPITKKIQPENPEKNKLVRYDHNSERYTFEMDRMLEGHDMSLCDIVQIHYINVSSNKQKKNEDIYEVNDLGLLSGNEDRIAFTWLVSRNATMLDGILTFAIRFACSNGDSIDYELHTEIFSSISISNTIINNGQSIVEEYSDILNQWKKELFGIEGTIQTAKRESLAAIDKNRTDSLNAINSDSRKAIDAINFARESSLEAIDRYGLVQVSEEDPTNPNIDMHINPNTTESFTVPEIIDDSIGPEDTWSSEKINTELSKVNTDVTALKEDLTALDNVVTLEKSVELIQYKWTIVPINIKSGDAIIIKNPHGLCLPARTLSAFSEISKVEEFNINSDKEYIFKATKDAVGIAFYQETSPVENVEVIRHGMDKDVAELRTKVDIIANYNVEKHFNDLVNYENAYVDTNGELVSTLSWRTTDYIECASIVDRKIRIYCKQLPTVQYISYYNKYKCHIGGIVGTKNMYVAENLVIPVNAHYIRLSFLEDNAQYYSYDASRQSESAMAIQKTSNPLYGKKIACTGDSITAATDSVPGNGYADLIAKGNGATVSNHAIWGAVLAQGKTNTDGTPKGCIYDTIAQMPADADVVLMSGGINDADYWNEPSYWGTMTGDYTSALDTKTFAGALEAMCKDALLKWAGKPIIYVIEHKMTNNFNSDYGKHFEEVEYPLIKKILEKWGISYVDLYKDMPSLSFVHDYKKRYSVDNKGVHPNVEGYLKFYVPRVESEIIRLLR